MERLHDRLSELDIDLSASAVERLLRYRDLILEASHRVGLVSETERERLEDHLAESLVPLKFEESLRAREARKLLDMGSGAGFPGVPLAVAFPETEVVALESREKRVGFLKEVKEALDLNNFRVERGRGEEKAHEAGWRSSFDVVTGRAVAPLPVFLEIVVPFLKIGGGAWAFKGPRWETELLLSESILPEVGAEAGPLFSYSLGESANRFLLSFVKAKEGLSSRPRSAQRLRHEAKRFHQAMNRLEVAKKSFT